MATLTLRVDDAVRDELDRAARARGTTISDLLRSAINDLLGFEDAGAQDRENSVVVPRTLDVVQRRMFAMMHEMLGKLADDEDDKEYHQRHAEVMTEGFAGEYYAEFGFMSAELTPAECSRLNDILEMFRVLEFSLSQLSPADRERLGHDADHVLIFDGFDLQKPAESRLLSYAKHMVKDEDNWAEFRERLTTGERGNTHSSRLARYLRMHRAYTAIRDKNISGRGHRRDDYLFDVDDLSSMIEAAWHPVSER
jgi:uncharacterized protein YfbU (UPF0304 family)